MPVPAMEAGNDYTPNATNRGWKWLVYEGFERWQLLSQK
jgi:hypothetical protein